MPPAVPLVTGRKARAAAETPPSPHDAELEAQKRSFLRMASHELRTPLNSILGFSEMIASEAYGPLGAPQYKEYAKIIQGSGQKLLRLVNQVLEVARLEGQAVDWDLRAEPLDTAIEEVLASLDAVIAARGVRISVADAANLPAVLADARGLRTVLCNLIQNAVTFSPEGGEIRIRARRQDDRVQIFIENDGEGVDPAELPRLLRPFEQGESALTRQNEGAGLGLSICALTCQGMGGHLRLHSALGDGLTAQVWLKRG